MILAVQLYKLQEKKHEEKHWSIPEVEPRQTVQKLSTSTIFHSATIIVIATADQCLLLGDKAGTRDTETTRGSCIVWL